MITIETIIWITLSAASMFMTSIAISSSGRARRRRERERGYRPLGPAVDPTKVFVPGMKASAAEPMGYYPTMWIGEHDPGTVMRRGDTFLPVSSQDARLLDTLLWARIKWEEDGLPEEIIRLANENLRVLIRNGECPMLDGGMYEQGLPKGFSALGEIPPPGPDVIWPWNPDEKSGASRRARPPVEEDDFDYVRMSGFWVKRRKPAPPPQRRSKR